MADFDPTLPRDQLWPILRKLRVSQIIQAFNDETRRQQVYEYLINLRALEGAYMLSSEVSDAHMCAYSTTDNLPLVFLSKRGHQNGYFADLASIDRFEAMGIPYGLIVYDEIPANAKSFTSLCISRYTESVVFHRSYPNVTSLIIRRKSGDLPTAFPNVESLEIYGFSRKPININNLRFFPHLRFLETTCEFNSYDFFHTRLEYFISSRIPPSKSIILPESILLCRTRGRIANLRDLPNLKVFKSGIKENIFTALTMPNITSLNVSRWKIINKKHIAKSNENIRVHECGRAPGDNTCDCPIVINRAVKNITMYNVRDSVTIVNDKMSYIYFQYVDNVKIFCDEIDRLEVHCAKNVEIYAKSIGYLRVSKCNKINIVADTINFAHVYCINENMQCNIIADLTTLILFRTKILPIVRTVRKIVIYDSFITLDISWYRGLQKVKLKHKGCTVTVPRGTAVFVKPNSNNTVLLV